MRNSFKHMTILSVLMSSLLLAGCSSGTPAEEHGHEHTYSEEWSSDETYHWHKATCEHTDEVSGKAKHDYHSFGFCECGKYSGTTLESLATVELPDLKYAENAYYKIDLKAGNYSFEVDYALVTTFIYFKDSKEAVASPKETNPISITELSLDVDKTVYIDVINNNGTVASGAKLTISHEHSYNSLGICEICGEYGGTVLETIGTYDLPNLEYAEKACFKIKLEAGKYNFEVDYGLVTTFIYSENSEEIATPEQTNPTTLTVLNLKSEQTVYVKVVNNNGTVVSGAKLTISVRMPE